MKRITIAALAAGILLAGCATSQNSIVAGLESAYIAADSAELVYLQSGKADPAVVAQIETYRKQAQAALAPVVSAAASGGSAASAAQIEVAQAALSALTTYLTQQHVAAVPAS